jgi:hypothetical protein
LLHISIYHLEEWSSAHSFVKALIMKGHWILPDFCSLLTRIIMWFLSIICAELHLLICICWIIPAFLQ